MRSIDETAKWPLRAARRLGLLAVGVLLVTVPGCERSPTTPETPEARFLGKAAPRTTVVEVRAVREGGQHLFDLSVDQIPSGWTTLRFDNQAPVHHFGFVSKVPEFVTLDQYHQEITLPFQNFLDVVFLERDPSFPDAGFEFAEWFGDIVFLGGPGLTAPGRISQTTLNLEPGNYIIECYMKSPGGFFHSVDRMLAQLTVTEEPSGAPEPRGTLEMTLLNPENGGIQAADEVRPGKQTVSVHFAEQTVHGNLVGNDVHLVRLDDGTDLAELAAWMNWAVPAGLTAPAPAEFLGGAHDMAVGQTAYFTVLLRPGTYAWIAEVDDPDEKSMLKTFSVPFGRATGR